MKISIPLLNLIFGFLFLVGRSPVVCQEATETLAQSEEAVDDAAQETVATEPVQSGPLIDLLGTKLQSLEMVDEQSAQVKEHYTNEVLSGKKVIGLYFSADWYVLLFVIGIVSPLVHSRSQPSSTICVF